MFSTASLFAASDLIRQSEEHMRGLELERQRRAIAELKTQSELTLNALRFQQAEAESLARKRARENPDESIPGRREPSIVRRNDGTRRIYSPDEIETRERDLSDAADRYLRQQQLALEERRVAALESQAQATRNLKAEYDGKLRDAIAQMRAEESKRAQAQYDREFDASEARARAAFAFVSDKTRAGFKLMVQIDQQLEEKQDPLFNDPTKPYRIAEMANERLQQKEKERIKGNVERARAKGVLPVRFTTLPLQERRDLIAARQEYLTKVKP